MDAVDFGSLRRTTPVSGNFGFDRGRPVDRYYIEAFLAKHSDDVKGAVLEIGDDRYTRRFGGGCVTRCDVLHLSSGDPKATVVADLENAGELPSDQYDCVVFTQTLQYLYDTRAGLRTLYRILRPGGVLLATFPGVSRTNDSDWGDRWYWNLTTRSARRLFAEVFGPEAAVVTGHGNVLACAASLFGLADWELRPEELQVYDPGFEVVITARAVK